MPEERDEFDRIVEHLDLDMSFPDDPPPEPKPQPSPLPRELEPSDSQDDQFYRRVQPVSRPWKRGSVMAWSAVLGAPAILVGSSVFAIILPRHLLAVLALLFVAGAGYLITRLPEHGPSDRDDPDDGAVL